LGGCVYEGRAGCGWGRDEWGCARGDGEDGGYGEMVVSVEAGEEGTQALGTTREVCSCGTISPSIKSNSEFTRTVKKPVRVEFRQANVKQQCIFKAHFDRIPPITQAYIHLAHLLTMRDTFLRTG